MLKSNGFTLIEVIIAASILMMVVTTFIPIFSLLNNERSILSDRRAVASHLHDELQQFLWNKQTVMPVNFTETVQNKIISFHFKTEDDIIKGCANWINVKNYRESICLYGYPQK